MTIKDLEALTGSRFFGMERSRKCSCRDPKGIYLNEFPGEFQMFLLWILLGLFLGKTQDHLESTAKSTSAHGSFVAKSTQHGSVLEKGTLGQNQRGITYQFRDARASHLKISACSLWFPHPGVCQNLARPLCRNVSGIFVV